MAWCPSRRSGHVCGSSSPLFWCNLRFFHGVVCMLLAWHVWLVCGVALMTTPYFTVELHLPDLPRLVPFLGFCRILILIGAVRSSRPSHGPIMVTEVRWHPCLVSQSRITPLPLVRPSFSSQGLFLLGVVWFYNGYFVFIHVVVDVDLSSFLFFLLSWLFFGFQLVWTLPLHCHVSRFSC
jgi:hypothetical protein